MSDAEQLAAPLDADLATLSLEHGATSTNGAHDAGVPPERAAPTPEERRAAERQRLVDALSTGRADVLLERVTWILSRCPETRNSDTALSLRYWQEYEEEQYAELADGNTKALFGLTPSSSITRARARIQNTHNLFQASADVRKRRGRLSDEERERYMNPAAPDPLITVFADESGKTDANLVVGSVWFLDPGEVVTAYNRVTAWRRARGFDEELHFNKLSLRTLPLYREVVELVLNEIAGISFKAVSVSRAGISDVAAAIDQLFLEVLRRGVEHEHATGRAVLPRRLMVYKDLEEAGRDALLASRLRTALISASTVELEGRLQVEEIEPIKSETHPLMQIADLYTASVNRSLARTSTSDRPKDVFTDYLLERVRGVVDATERVGDLEVHLRL